MMTQGALKHLDDLVHLQWPTYNVVFCKRLTAEQQQSSFFTPKPKPGLSFWPWRSSGLKDSPHHIHCAEIPGSEENVHMIPISDLSALPFTDITVYLSKCDQIPGLCVN
jgi:hypothetical protein